MTDQQIKGSVYILGDYNNEHIYKIGVTRGSVENRVKKLQTGNSGEIYIVKTFKSHCPFFVEHWFHRIYQHKKVMNEWFELTKDDIQEFEQHCEQFQKMFDVNESIKNSINTSNMV